jgi:hypothetical protein
MAQRPPQPPTAPPENYTPLPAELGAAQARWVTWRSGLLGTAAVLLICGLTPYNDYIVANTYLVGSYLPIIVAIWMFLFIVLVNAPLHRFLPRHALSSGELAVMLGMMLVACSLPSSGLMRVIIPMMVAPLHFGAIDEQFWQALTQLELPSWLNPAPVTEEGRTSWIVTSFYGRLHEDIPVPFDAWVPPLIGWGVFVFALFATLIGMMILIRRQWAENERLPFPIVQLQLALIESPAPGRALNSLFRGPAFWIALCGVFAVQSSAALHLYFPRTVPEVPLTYDLHSILANEPWVHFSGFVKSNRVYFTFIGVTYFIQSRVGFSLWAIFLITQIINVQQAMFQRTVHGGALMDQHLGASVAFIAGILFIGRHHWWMVLRQAFVGARPGEHTGDYLSNRTAVFTILIGLLVMIFWLIMLNVQPWVAVVLIGFILMAQLVVARVVAETGIPFFRAFSSFSQVYSNLPPAWLSGQDVYFAQKLTLMGPVMTREALAPFAIHALQVHEQTAPPPRQRHGFLAMICWALLLGFAVSATASIWTYYNHATPLTDRVHPIPNQWGLEGIQHATVVNPMKQHADGRYPPKPYNPWLHMGLGAGIMSFLQFAALRWTAWPFMPVGYIMSMTWYAHAAWFSVFIGWLCKVLLVKYGGARMYQAARPFFIGIIFGEALAAGFWLLVTMYLAQAGYDYQVVRFLPD